jgi:uncharacterized protein (DUF924 family)
VFDEILQFWFQEIDPASWWAKDENFDAQISARFGDVHRAAARCELFAWRAVPTGRLAEVIVLDQFSRNMFRDRAEAFAHDPLALALAQEAVRSGADRALTPTQRNFLYMPYMHSESMPVHEAGAALFASNGIDSTIEAARKHRSIVERFGRYPHRNAILGRTSTPDELAFLEQPGSSF